MATKTKKTTDKYKPNQFVVHPHHGAAKVVRRVNKNVEIFDENGEVKSKRRQYFCLLYTSPSPRDKRQSRMPSSA